MERRVIKGARNFVECHVGQMNESSLFHVYQTLGERRTQEDVWSTCKIFEGVYLHAVFDGHGGKEVAMDAAKTLKKILKQKMTHFDMKLLADEASVRSLMIDVFHETDKSVFAFNRLQMGSTCSAVLCVTELNLIYFVQLGDSRACLMGVKSGVIFKTTDHKPQFEKEKQRIVSAGGEVTRDIGPYRVNRTLAVARSFGDWGLERDWDVKVGPYQYQVQYPKSCLGSVCIISKEPDVTRVSLDNYKDEQVCLLLCSDGLTDVFTEEVLYDQLFNKITQKFNAENFENTMANSNFNDNTTAIVIIQNLPPRKR
jgi:serine/threonine protein phosphatase PrpC